MKIAILGASPGGLAFALMLKRFGLEAEIFAPKKHLCEQSDRNQAIFVWPQGVQTLRFLLSPHQCMQAGHPVDYLGIHNSKGEPLYRQRVPMEEHDFSMPAVMFHRQTLLQRLREALNDQPIHYGMSCNKTISLGSKSLLYFSDGSAREFDLVVDAEGIDSCTRRFVSGEAPHDTGIAVHSGMVHFDSPMLADDSSQIFLHENARLVTCCVDRQSHFRYWSVAYMHNSDPLWNKAALLKNLEGLAPPLLEMIDTTRIDEGEPTLLRSMTGKSQWYRDCNLLLDNCAHATLSPLGYSTTLELENGFMLAKSLVGCGYRDLPWVLRRYQRDAIQQSKEMLSLMDEVSDWFYRGDEYETSRIYMSKHRVARAGSQPGRQS